MTQIVDLLKDHSIRQAEAMSKFSRGNVRLSVCGVGVMLPLMGPAQPDTLKRDGQHDFDFEIGVWKTHLKRLVNPLSGSSSWVELDGTTVVRKVWNGRANLAELVADSPSGRLEVLSLRLYNPQARQWSLNTANVDGGTLSQPTIGGFKDGRGEFFDQESFKGRNILVRNVWSDITANSCHFEQAFSEDGGKTWEVNWIAEDTRVSLGKL
jgi:hypothetical protein